MVFWFQIWKNEEHNDPFQNAKDQKRTDIDRHWQENGVHNVEGQMEHYWQ
jgi:hypothetical protein